MGGMKSSGMGRRHGEAGLLRFTEAQTIAAARGVSLTTPTTQEAARYMTGMLRAMAVFGRR